ERLEGGLLGSWELEIGSWQPVSLVHRSDAVPWPAGRRDQRGPGNWLFRTLQQRAVLLPLAAHSGFANRGRLFLGPGAARSRQRMRMDLAAVCDNGGFRTSLQEGVRRACLPRPLWFDAMPARW